MLIIIQWGSVGFYIHYEDEDGKTVAINNYYLCLELWHAGPLLAHMKNFLQAC